MRVFLKTAFTISVIYSVFCLRSSIAQSNIPSWFIPANQLETEISTSISYVKNTKQFSYKYTVENLTSSKKPLFLWGIAKRFSESQLRGPDGWLISVYCEDDFSAWGYLDGELNPGQSATGFSITSPLMPGIVNYYYQSDPSSTLMPDRPSKPTEEDYEAFDTLSSFPTNYAKGLTIGPSVEPFYNLEQAFGYLEQNYRLVVSNGWIYNKGIEKAISQKLEHINKSLKKGDNQALHHIEMLSQYLITLNSKRLDPNARSLMIVLCEYVSSL